ncbi:DUF4375 domain-containing protein [Asticcacaulis sp.]|jgi:hypothetical protein|uniref:DMP19 family protein n=1 Tax=Asticcacaulis sp. TaxID=1872648 RepID=UPI00391BD282
MTGYWRLIEPYWENVSIYDGYDVFRKAFDTLPESSQHLFAAHWAQSEIYNGGFDQFFDNSTGVLALEATEGFKALGMPKIAALLKHSVDRLGETYPHDREERQEKLESLSEGFEDGLFFDLIDTEAGGFKIAADLYASKVLN